MATKQPTVVLINGKKRSGKDFCAGKLKRAIELRGKTVEVLSLATPLKNIVQTAFNISAHDLDYYKNNTETIKISVQKYGVRLVDLNFRQLLQRLGTESLIGMFGENVWVDLLEKKIIETSSDFVLVPDFRFKHEHTLSAETVKIRNDFADSTDVHKSENDLNDFDFKYTIDNTNYQDVTEQIKKLTDELVLTNETKGLNLTK